MKTRSCQWCGDPVPPAKNTEAARKKFCSRSCKDAAGNYMASRGKVIMPMLLAWRAKRGRKGTSGAAAYQEMQQFVDACVAELVAQGVPTASGFYEGRESTGVSTWKDFERRRPSRLAEESEEE